MNPNLTEIAFVLDRSGSMEAMKVEAIGSFNHFIEVQKKEPGDVRFTLVLFDHEYEKLFDHMVLSEVPPLTDQTYEPRGNTALLDAMGRTIDEIGQRLAATPENQRPSKVIVACLTDGFENASKHYDNTKIAQMIDHQRSVYSWEFVFLGATLESRVMAESWTLPSEDVQAIVASPSGMRRAMAVQMSEAIMGKRQRK